jgi:hypothetical protein
MCVVASAPAPATTIGRRHTKPRDTSRKGATMSVPVLFLAATVLGAVLLPAGAAARPNDILALPGFVWVRGRNWGG